MADTAFPGRKGSVTDVGGVVKREQKLKRDTENLQRATKTLAGGSAVMDRMKAIIAEMKEHPGKVPDEGKDAIADDFRNAYGSNHPLFQEWRQAKTFSEARRSAMKGALNDYSKQLAAPSKAAAKALVEKKDKK